MQETTKKEGKHADDDYPHTEEKERDSDEMSFIALLPNKEKERVADNIVTRVIYY